MIRFIVGTVINALALWLVTNLISAIHLAPYGGDNFWAIAGSFFIFVIPFLFIILMAFKDRSQSALRDFSWPEGNHLWENLVEVVTTRNWMMITAFINSSIITLASVTLLVIFAAMVGYVLARRKTRLNGLIEFLILAGLMIPPAVVPTIWLMQGLKLFGTLHGMVLIEVAYNLPFSIILYRFQRPT